MKKEYEEKQRLKREKRKEEKGKDKDKDTKKKEEDQDKEDEKANSDKVGTNFHIPSTMLMLINDMRSSRNCPSPKMSRKLTWGLAFTR